MAQSFAATITNAKHVSMACAVINNGKPTGNILFCMEGGRMSILTKPSRRRTCFEGYSYLSRKVSKSNQLQSQCCKQDPSSDKRLRCTKSSKKGVVADLSHTKRQVAIWRIQPSKHSHIKVYRQTMKGVCRFIQKGFYWRKEKKDAWQA